MARTLTLGALVRCGLWILLALVPFHSVLVVPGVSVTRAVGLFLALVWLLWIAAGLAAGRASVTFSRTTFSVIVLLSCLLASILLSLLYATPSLLYASSTVTVLSGIVMAVIIATIVRSERALRRACAALVLGGTTAGLLVVAQLAAPVFVSELFQQRLFSYGSTIRATGPFRDPNYGAFTLIVLACVSFYLALAQRTRWQRTLLFVSVGTQVVAVLLTFSRSNYVTLALASLAILWRERYRLRLWKAALVLMSGLILLATIGGGVLDLVSARAKTIVEFARFLWREELERARQVDLSLWYRFHLLRAGIKMAFDRFPIGVGWENFRYQVTQYSDEVRPQGAHNTYVAVAAELGLPGLLALAWLLWALWGSTSRLCKIAQGSIGLLARGTRYGLLAVLMGGLFLTVLHEAVVWALIGLIMAQNRVVFRAAKAREIGAIVG